MHCVLQLEPFHPQHYSSPSSLSHVPEAGKALCTPDRKMLACSASPQTYVIKDGDLVIVYESYASMKAIVVTKNGRFDNRYGSFAHKVT